MLIEWWMVFVIWCHIAFPWIVALVTILIIVLLAQEYLSK